MNNQRLITMDRLYLEWKLKQKVYDELYLAEINSQSKPKTK